MKSRTFLRWAAVLPLALSPAFAADIADSAKQQLAQIQMTPLGEAGERPYQRGGAIVCHCERVTTNEVTSACAASSSSPAARLTTPAWPVAT